MMGEGTVNDEELVEVIAGAECTCAPAWKDRGLIDDKCWRHRVADVLSEIRSAGFQVFNPEDCEVGVADGVTFANNPDGKDGLILLVPSRSHTADRGTYFLVPADSGGSG